jgi:hypothetical protein
MSNAADPEHETQQSTVAVEGAGGHPADLLGYHQNRRRRALPEVVAPDLVLQSHALP